MPPAPTGVADYSSALLAALSRQGEVRLERDGDVNLYHLGNNPLHAVIYERALRRPGAVVLHDAVLHHFLLGTLGRAQYIEEFVFNYGEWTRDLAAGLWDNRARSGIDPAYFAYPMLRRQMTSARAVIVHNRAAARMAEQHGARRVIEIPHLAGHRAPVSHYEVARVRERLGVKPGTFLFGVFGHLRESKRIPGVLRALARVRSSGVDAALLVAGDFVSGDVERSLRPMLEQEGVFRVGHLPEADFWLHAAAVDACINLRYPQAGESSGIAIRLMSLGKPVIASAGEEMAAFPETTVLRVDPGVAETDMLSEYMTWLAGMPLDAREIGRRGAEHLARHHAPERVAAAYWRALREVA